MMAQSFYHNLYEFYLVDIIEEYYFYWYYQDYYDFLEKIDKKFFHRYFVDPVVKECGEAIDSNHVIESLSACFECSYEYDKKKRCFTSFEVQDHNDALDFLRMYFGITFVEDIWELINKHPMKYKPFLNDQNKLILKEALKNPNFYSILESSGIIQSLLASYQKLQSHFKEKVSV